MAYKFGSTPSSLDPNTLTSGEGTMDRLILKDSIALTSQELRLAYFTALKTETTTQVRILTGSTAAAATPTVCRIGLYTVASDGSLTLVASTANDTALFNAANSNFTKSWSSSYAKQAGQRYALGVLVVSATTMPHMVGFNPHAGAGAEVGLAPRLASRVSGQADLPSSVASGSVLSTNQVIYGAILP